MILIIDDDTQYRIVVPNRLDPDPLIIVDGWMDGSTNKPLKKSSESSLKYVSM